MEAKTAKYLTVKQSLKRQIEDGTLRVNDKLPSEAEYAQIYGVSTITVRRALTELAEEGYIKRMKHKGTFVTSSVNTSQASHLIALILYSEDHNDSSYISIIKGAQNMAAAHNYSLIVEWNDGGTAQEAASIQRMLNLKVEGFLIYSYDPTKSIDNYRYLEEKKLPFVLLDRYDLNYPCYFSGCNNYDGGAVATQLLIDAGHRNIRFAGYHYFLKSEQERFDGFCSAMRRAGLEAGTESLLLNIDYDALSRQIRAREVTAVFCCNDRLAVGLIQALRQRGLRVPEEVSVVGFDNWTASPDVERELTTVRQDFAEIGTNAAYLLFGLLQGKLTENPVKLLSHAAPVIRSSVSKPAR